jgi:hypothetical protein
MEVTVSDYCVVNYTAPAKNKVATDIGGKVEYDKHE